MERGLNMNIWSMRHCLLRTQAQDGHVVNFVNTLCYLKMPNQKGFLFWEEGRLVTQLFAQLSASSL